MKTAQSTLRVSHLTYIRVMDALIAEVANLEPAEAVEIIAVVTAYLHSADGVEAIDSELLRRYFDIIDRAALRSARARQAAINRRKANATPTEIPAQTPTETPKEIHTEAPTEPSPTPIQNPKFKIPLLPPQFIIPNPPSKIPPPL